MVYQPLYHAGEIVFAKRNQQDLAIFLDCFNKTIIPLALLGYEKIIANSALPRWLSIISYRMCARALIILIKLQFKLKEDKSV